MKSARLKIEKRRSEIRSRLGEIRGLAGDAKTSEIKAEEVELDAEFSRSELSLREAMDAEDLEVRAARETAGGLTAEQAERLELRSRARFGAYVEAAIRGRAVQGAEAELMEAAGVDGIPLELWDTRESLEARAQRQNGVEHRVLTPAPGTTGVNLDPIQPAVFAPSIARKGERYFTASVLVGDVILVQPDAYSQVAFRVST